MARPAVYKGDVYKFPERLKGWREAAHLSQKDLAEFLGVTQQTVSDWERGKILPSTSRSTALDQALGLEPQTVLLALFDDLQLDTGMADIEVLKAPHHRSVSERLAALEAAAERQEAALHEILVELRSRQGSR